MRPRAQILPHRMRKYFRSRRFDFNFRSDQLRHAHAIGETPLPNALIIGAQKGGTTSLRGYLKNHSDVHTHTKGEIHYFDQRYDMPVDWYRYHFCPKTDKPIYLDTTPEYLLDPRVPGRVAQLLPDAKLIIMLRDPVVRAYSHWAHAFRRHREHLPFEDAIAMEPDRLRKCWEKIYNRNGPLPYNMVFFSYATRGCYVWQIRNWVRHFSRHQMIFVESESLFENPTRELSRITDFLNIAPLDTGNFQNRNRGTGGDAVPEPTASRLRTYFNAQNAGLHSLTGQSFRWAPTS